MNISTYGTCLSKLSSITNSKMNKKEFLAQFLHFYMEYIIFTGCKAAGQWLLIVVVVIVVVVLLLLVLLVSKFKKGSK